MIQFFIILLLVVSIVACVLENRVKETVEGENEVPEQAVRKVKKIIYRFILALILVITLCNCGFTTDEQQIAFTMTFGHTTMVEKTGFNFKIPFITKVYKFDATTQGMAIGYDTSSNESQYEESLMITSDFNFVNIDFYVEYRISDPIQYQFGSTDPEGILENISQAAIRNTVGLYDVDSVITTGKGEIEAQVKSNIIQELQLHNTGLTVTNVTIQDAEPPTAEVANAFKEVENAKQGADTAVNNAQKVKEENIPSAEAEADKILRAAEATKTERINQATQEVAEFNALYQEYIQNPDTVKKQLYYSAMEEILPNMEIIIGNDSKVIYIKNGDQVTAQ